MKNREITATGTINHDGRLVMYMGEINEFFAGWKGQRVIARFTIASPGTSEALRGYYFNCIVPTFRRALWDTGDRMTEEQAERKMREYSPIMHEEVADVNTGKYTHILRSVAELSNAELIEHIETIKQIAAEEFNVYIEDPMIL